MLVAVLIATYYECSKHINVQECLKLQQDCKNQYFLKIRLFGIANAPQPYFHKELIILLPTIHILKNCIDFTLQILFIFSP